MKKLLLPMFAFAFFILALLTFFYFLSRPSPIEESYQVKAARTQAQLDEIERDKTVSSWWALYWPLVACHLPDLMIQFIGTLHREYL